MPEPEAGTDNKNYQYASKDYLCSFSLFIIAASVFIACFFFTANTAAFCKDSLDSLFSNPYLAGFLIELARFFIALSSALLTAYLLGMTGIVNREMIDDTYIAPVKDFFQRYGALLAVLLLFLIGLYRISDIVLGVISADNLAAGLSCAAFVAFLSSLTNIRFTAVQYAIFSSLMMLIPKIFGGYSGTIVDNLSYEAFFLITALLGVPVLVLIRFAGKYIKIQ